MNHNHYVVLTYGGEYIIEAVNSDDARLKAKRLSQLMDDPIKDVHSVKRSEHKAIYEDIKHG